MDRLLRPLLTVCLALSTTSLVAQDLSPGFFAPARQIDHASPGVLELRWSELAPLLQGTRVDITLTDGTMLHGEILALRDDGWSWISAAPRRRRLTAAGAACRARLCPSSGSNGLGGACGRHLGTVIGVLSGVVIGAYVTGRAADSASLGIPLFLSVASGITVAGYYGGRRLDRRVTTIRVMP